MKTFTKAIAAAALLASSVTAQYKIDPNTIDEPTRQYWCQQQQDECPLICLQPPSNSGETLSNTCDWEALTYSCVCGDGLSPNISEYSQTLPYFICTAWGTQCVSNCNGDSACAASCQQDHPCGAQNPTRQNTSTSTRTMMMISTTTGGAGAGATVDSEGHTIYTGWGASGAAQTGAADAEGSATAVVLHTGRTFGTLIVFGLMTLGFAVLL